MKTTDTLLNYTANKQTNKQKNVGKHDVINKIRNA